MKWNTLKLIEIITNGIKTNVTCYLSFSNERIYVQLYELPFELEISFANIDDNNNNNKIRRISSKTNTKLICLKWWVSMRFHFIVSYIIFFSSIDFNSLLLWCLLSSIFFYRRYFSCFVQYKLLFFPGGDVECFNVRIQLECSVCMCVHHHKSVTRHLYILEKIGNLFGESSYH